jgi:hypothetical protein
MWSQTLALDGTHHTEVVAACQECHPDNDTKPPRRTRLSAPLRARVGGGGLDTCDWAGYAWASNR